MLRDEDLLDTRNDERETREDNQTQEYETWG
jgi:hypothetical protein